MILCCLLYLCLKEVAFENISKTNQNKLTAVAKHLLNLQQNVILCFLFTLRHFDVVTP